MITSELTGRSPGKGGDGQRELGRQSLMFYYKVQYSVCKTLPSVSRTHCSTEHCRPGAHTTTSVMASVPGESEDSCNRQWNGETSSHCGPRAQMPAHDTVPPGAEITPTVHTHPKPAPDSHTSGRAQRAAPGTDVSATISCSWASALRPRSAGRCSFSSEDYKTHGPWTSRSWKRRQICFRCD